MATRPPTTKAIEEVVEKLGAIAAKPMDAAERRAIRKAAALLQERVWRVDQQCDELRAANQKLAQQVTGARTAARDLHYEDTRRLHEQIAALNHLLEQERALRQLIYTYGAKSTAPTSRAHSTLGLETTATAAEIRTRHRELLQIHHPDRGGRAEVMAAINTARDEALRLAN